MVDAIEAIADEKQFAYQYVSHGFYSNFINSPIGNRRREITKSLYVDPVIQDYGTSQRINNLFRANTVTLTTRGDIADPIVVDNTLLK